MEEESKSRDSPVLPAESRKSVEAPADQRTDGASTDLPFLVTHWLAHYNQQQHPQEQSPTVERRAEEWEAIQRIHRAASELSSAFHALGSFGTTTRVSQILGCRSLYSTMDMVYLGPLFSAFRAAQQLTPFDLGVLAIVVCRQKSDLRTSFYCRCPGYVQRSETTVASSVSTGSLGTPVSLGSHNRTSDRITSWIDNKFDPVEFGGPCPTGAATENRSDIAGCH